MSEEELIAGCIRQDRKCQEQLYKQYSRQMFGVCLGYAKDYSAAKDMLQDGFIKVFGNLSHYSKQGSFEGWIRRIIVNTAIDHYRKSVRILKTIESENAIISDPVDESIYNRLNEEDLMKVIGKLPDGYRIVFNLYVVEGYSHKEIGEKLGISEGTSKSQLSRAKKILQDKITKLYEQQLPVRHHAGPVLQMV